MEYSDLQDGAFKEKSRVAFGFFDGLHLGHKAVIDRLHDHDAQVPVVLSFEETEAPVIYTEYEKKYLLRQFGIDKSFSMRSEVLKDMCAEAFAREILFEKLHAASVVVGENLSFGRDGKGAKELVEYGKKYGFSVDVVPVVRVDGEIVSADAVKRAIRDCDFPKMERLLGHTYVIIGKIVHGKAQGHRHGMPTANLAPAANKLFPPYGVYATLSGFDGTLYRGLTNIGLRPSVDASPIPTVETLLLNFSESIYDQEVVLELHAYIRGIMKFAGGLEDVRKQIDKDLIKANAFFGQLPARMQRC